MSLLDRRLIIPVFEKSIFLTGELVKNKIIIGIILALFLVFTLTTPSFAATPQISSVAPNSGVQGNTYSNIVITGLSFIGATVVSFGESITTNSYSVDNDTQITANITIAAGANIGTRDVSVTTPEGTDIEIDAFTVIAANITVTAPVVAALGDMVRGETVTATASPAGSVTTNADNWQVTAKDEITADPNKGYMSKTGPAYLVNKLQISKTSITEDLADANTGITYDETSNPSKSLPFYVSQVIDASEVPGSYSITITFTGTTQ
jgi:hypothetical protein